jgi:hypothetical protein
MATEDSVTTGREGADEPLSAARVRDELERRGEAIHGQITVKRSPSPGCGKPGSSPAGRVWVVRGRATLARRDLDASLQRFRGGARPAVVCFRPPPCPPKTGESAHDDHRKQERGGTIAKNPEKRSSSSRGRSASR